MDYDPRYETSSGRLIHPCLNPHDADPDLTLYVVRLDDRGDLRTYVWASSGLCEGDAAEWAEEHAGKRGWGVDPDDVCVFHADDDERAAVLRHCTDDDTDG
jgi:hypothetical protein